LPETITTTLENLIKTHKILFESTNIPRFDVVVKKDHLGNIQNFILSFLNIKDSFSKIKDLPLNPLDNLYKLSSQILQQNNLPPNLTLNEIIMLLKEKSLEKKLANTVNYFLTFFNIFFFF